MNCAAEAATTHRLDNEGAAMVWEVRVCEEHHQLLRIGEDWMAGEQPGVILMGSHLSPKVLDFEVLEREGREGLIRMKLTAHSNAGFQFSEFLLNREMALSLAKALRLFLAN
jgi:hypothetical protein